MNRMARTAHGTFDVELVPHGTELDGAVARMDMTKSFHGDLDAVGAGIMLSAGDAPSGTAGYVAIETVRGSLAGVTGGFALQQFGTMQSGAQTLHYAIVPGSGSGELAGVTGFLILTIDPDGTHRYELVYEL